MSFDVLYEPLVAATLREDLGRAGDITSNAIIDADLRSNARIVARQAGVIAGLDVATLAFRLLDPTLEIELNEHNGAMISAETTIARIVGSTRSILAGERTALNFLGHLSGIASMTRAFVDAVAGTATAIVCTRKTTPGLRALEKAAVRAGGGQNHRFGLDDAVLIKDNHLAAAGSLTTAVERVRASVGHLVRIEVEIDTLTQLDEALDLGVDLLLLDNMDTSMLRVAVARTAGRARLEASGSVRLANVRAIAETGVDLISVGALTHSSPNLDVSLEIEHK